MKKLFIIFTLFVITLFTFVQKACAEEIFKFTSANFDTSNSMIVLTAQDTETGSVLPDVKLVKMEIRQEHTLILTLPLLHSPSKNGFTKQVQLNKLK